MFGCEILCHIYIGFGGILRGSLGDIWTTTLNFMETWPSLHDYDMNSMAP